MEAHAAHEGQRLAKQQPKGQDYKLPSPQPKRIKTGPDAIAPGPACNPLLYTRLKTYSSEASSPAALF